MLEDEPLVNLKRDRPQKNSMYHYEIFMDIQET